MAAAIPPKEVNRNSLKHPIFYFNSPLQQVCWVALAQQVDPWESQDCGYGWEQPHPLLTMLASSIHRAVACVHQSETVKSSPAAFQYWRTTSFENVVNWANLGPPKVNDMSTITFCTGQQRLANVGITFWASAIAVFKLISNSSSIYPSVRQGTVEQLQGALHLVTGPLINLL